MSKNATDNEHTLLRFLADWRKPDIPAQLPVTRGDMDRWRTFAKTLDHDLLLTIHFADWHINKLSAEDRFYFTLFSARNESLDAKKTAKKLMRKSLQLKDFRTLAEKLLIQYGSLGNLVVTLYELQEPLLMQRMEAAL